MTTPLNDKLVAVEVPEGSIKHSLHSGKVIFQKSNGSMDKILLNTNNLETGTYSILGTCSPQDVSFDPEPYLKKITFPNEPVYFKSYGDTDSVATTDKLASFRSLLQSKGLDIEKHYLVIEKI